MIWLSSQALETDSEFWSGTDGLEAGSTLTRSGLQSVSVGGDNRDTDLAIIHCGSPSLSPGSQECQSRSSAWGQRSFRCATEIC
jgi:hypothetical protein